MAGSQSRNLMNLVRLKGYPILKQLHLEEKLLRTSPHNWCIINDGTIEPTIVMGKFGKPEELLETESVLRDEIPVIRRFTGGDHNTIFVTFICNRDVIPGLENCIKPIMSWSSLIYKDVFQGIGDFTPQGNDYAFGNRKFGRNAWSLTTNRWIHHTSFLWDYEMSNMGYLKQPQKAPEYRQGRGHLEFICRMKEYISRSNFIAKTVESVGSHFESRSIELGEIQSCKFKPFSKLLERQELTGENKSVFQLS